ncbi:MULTISPECIES: endonuclease/exonuclease/phosphatase family protein [Flavobacteriaceae]|uniref:Endonuclease/exonuclease/phosphatase domain-containing protein n=2 Tax=Flavobacteriaceae TaxID=49546 RepID=A0A4Y8AVX8_9FLAO|nr:MULTISPECIES: endonuclease/exonuclease/phosphatase family protein [Flavobacteriaceae]TEW75530.1 hypothetical protein E2488_08465 [Gramella jeungdoensis]GGK45977.1 hypothetical protein GCM10007963_12790 [Lutibacter litoralis]
MKQIVSIILSLLMSNAVVSQTINNNTPIQFSFNESLNCENYGFKGVNYHFTKGIEGEALFLKSINQEFNNLKLQGLSIDGTTSFTIQFWVNTTSSKPTVLISQKEFKNKGISSQKNKGWVLYNSGGTLGWSIGSGKRRLNYERDNGDKMPLSNGIWHQITMTYEKELSEVRLYYDGLNVAIYKMSFDFFNNNPIIIGSQENSFDYDNEILPEIKNGVNQLQTLVDEFNKLKLENVTEDEFFSLIVDPEELYIRKLKIGKLKSDSLRKQKLKILKEVIKVHKNLYYNPYTVTQNHELTALKPINKIYYLKNGKVHINKYFANLFGEKERLYPSNFSIDNLVFWRQSLLPETILNSYNKHKLNKVQTQKEEEKKDTITVGVWNIWHGGTHFTINKDGWDSRIRIANILKKENVDIILMQETYSSGDFIAAELGYYFATTSDWDYCSQGSNISILSRYPIKELEVSKDTEFMNISVKIEIDQNQQIYAMSNWYGMSSFPLVYDFHKEKFDKADDIPILFGGDFNAVPHTDSGNSEASVKMLKNGFKDSYRELHPNYKKFPGYTH